MFQKKMLREIHFFKANVWVFSWLFFFSLLLNGIGSTLNFPFLKFIISWLSLCFTSFAFHVCACVCVFKKLKLYKSSFLSIKILLNKP